MPAVSKAQFRFMEMLAHNSAKMKMKPKGLTPAKAAEYVSHNVGEESYKNLPEKAERFSKLKKRMK
jgi:hypothetical protein